MSILKGAKKSFVCSAAACILIGALLCAWPVGVTNLVCIIAGAALACGGGWKLIGYFKKKDYGIACRIDFSVAALMTILGILLLSRPQMLVELVPVLLGVMVLVNSIFQTQVALELKSVSYTGWWHHLTVAIICAAAALVMMFNPFGSYRVLAFVIGAAFIVDGAVDLWTALYVTKKIRKTEP